MKYVGSKARFAKPILDIVLSERGDRPYVEPFVGGCNIIKYVTGTRIANDSNYYLIEMWRAIQSGWMPPKNVSYELWRDVRDNKQKYEPALVAFVGLACSFGARWFGGYARGKKSNGEPRNYALESYNHLMKQVPLLQGVEFYHGNYYDLTIPDNSIIYCDPPYAQTIGYANKFDSARFWEWAEQKAIEGHSVYVSEYNAPNQWRVLWNQTVKSSIDSKRGTDAKSATEKLFGL